MLENNENKAALFFKMADEESLYVTKLKELADMYFYGQEKDTMKALYLYKLINDDIYNEKVKELHDILFYGTNFL